MTFIPVVCKLYHRTVRSMALQSRRKKCIYVCDATRNNCNGGFSKLRVDFYSAAAKWSQSRSASAVRCHVNVFIVRYMRLSSAKARYALVQVQ